MERTSLLKILQCHIQASKCLLSNEHAMISSCVPGSPAKVFSKCISWLFHFILQKLSLTLGEVFVHFWWKIALASTLPWIDISIPGIRKVKLKLRKNALSLVDCKSIWTAREHFPTKIVIVMIKLQHWASNKIGVSLLICSWLL